jgi:hypothetical protein
MSWARSFRRILEAGPGADQREAVLGTGLRPCGGAARLRARSRARSPCITAPRDLPSAKRRFRGQIRRGSRSRTKAARSPRRRAGGLAPRARRAEPRATRRRAQPRSPRSCRRVLTSAQEAPLHALPMRVSNSASRTWRRHTGPRPPGARRIEPRAARTSASRRRSPTRASNSLVGEREGSHGPVGNWVRSHCLPYEPTE